MQFNLDLLMTEVGCRRYPERWNEIFDAAMREYDEKGCYLTKAEFYDDLHAKYGCFSKYGDVYKAAARQTAEDEVLGRFLTLLAMALQDDEHINADLKEFSRPITPEGKEPLAYNMVTGLALCSQIETGAENMRKRNFSEEKIKEVLTIAVGGVSTTERRNNGAPGFELLSWSQRYIEARLLLIERLEIEFFKKFSADAIVFRNQSGDIVTLAHELLLHRDGFALGATHFEDEQGAFTAYVEETEKEWIGHPFKENAYVSSEQVTLSKDEWEKVLQKGDPVIGLHIPPYGRMTPEQIDQTIEETKKFAKEHYPDYEYKAFTCISWLMDPQLDEILNKESNIVKFRQRFHSLTRKGSVKGVFNFIFNKPNMDFEIKDLPEDTSLQRALKKHYWNGKVIYGLEGFFCDKKEGEDMDLKMNQIYFMGIPVMDVPSAKFAKTEHYGAGSYVTVVEGTTKDDYQSYLKSVEEYGFVKYADSGAGLGETVLCSTYTRDELVLTVAYYSCENKTSIAFYQDMPLSEHLIYRDSYLENNKKGAQTSIHMMELRRLGNSFVFQLKNGHFLISDGGMPYDLPYLLDYLEELTPNGEKPVIEAWVISHAHGDHCGAFVAFLDHADWRDRVCVDGLYFSEPSARIIHRCGGEMVIAKTKRVARLLTTTEGNPTPLHRMQTGQRYYFNDITMDILLTQEQIPYEKYKKNLNTSSTVCLFTIEGQKCFFSGDIHQEGLEFIMANYSREFLDLDIFTLNHHGFDTCVSFVDYISVKTLLLTVQNQLPVRKIREINYFISKVQEAMVWGDGTKVLTFPYETGSYECLPCKEWIYNEGEERLLQMNIYTFPGRRLKGFIFHADEVVFHDKMLRPGMETLVKHLKENEVHMSIYSMKKNTAELAESLQSAGIEKYFELILGCEKLNADNPYTDATRQSEEVFRLDHVHKYVVVCHSDEVVEAAVQEGLRTIVVTYGIEIDKHLEEKCWESMDSLENIYELFERRKILFE